MLNFEFMKSHSFLWYLLFAALFAVQVLPRLWTDSLTNDEPMEITNGYFYLTHGDVVSHAHHPPLSKALESLPLLALRWKEPAAPADALDRAYKFCFRDNPGRLGTLAFLGRLSSLLLGLGLGFLLFRTTRAEPLPVFGAALGLWALDPTFSAFSALALADVPLAFFFLAALLSFTRAQESNSWKSALAAGVLSGMAVTCKFSGLVLLPVFLILELSQQLFPTLKKGGEGGIRFHQRGKTKLTPPGSPSFKEGKKEQPRFSASALSWPTFFQKWSLGLAGFGLWVFLIYLPGTLCLPGHLFPFHYFWDGFQEMAHYKGHPVYFMGQVGRVNHWAYFPTAFVLKTPLPFLILLAGGSALMVFRKIRLPLWQWMPGVAFFAAMIPTQDLGVRYLLPAYPFFMFVAAKAFGWLWERAGKKRLGKAALAGLGIFQAASVGLNFPHAVSYFNDLVTPERKFFWLGDSNLDISQDLKRLAETARQRGWDKVKLAYLGGVDPSAYGLSWEPWREGDLVKPRPGEVYAVNAGFFQLAPAFYPDTLSIAADWLSQETPTGRINDTWYYFEIPGRREPGLGGYVDSVPFQQSRGYAPLGAGP